MKNVTILIATITLAACTTPMTVLKNPKTGQIAQCGGSSSAAFTGGIIGYQMQKSSDSDCVSLYSQEGFKTIRVTE